MNLSAPGSPSLDYKWQQTGQQVATTAAPPGGSNSNRNKITCKGNRNNSNSKSKSNNRNNNSTQKAEKPKWNSYKPFPTLEGIHCTSTSNNTSTQSQAHRHGTTATPAPFAFSVSCSPGRKYRQRLSPTLGEGNRCWRGPFLPVMLLRHCGKTLPIPIPIPIPIPSARPDNNPCTIGPSSVRGYRVNVKTKSVVHKWRAGYMHSGFWMVIKFILN